MLFQITQILTGINREAIHFFADISDPDMLRKIDKKDDFVIHLAAQSHVDVSFNKPHQTILSNVLATENLMRACRRMRLPRF